MAAERKKIEAFEMWYWRRMLRIPWTAKRTNISILNELRVKDSLSTICLRRALQFFGHVARRDDGNLEKLVVVGATEGRIGRGSSPTRWTDQVKKALHCSVVTALRKAESREEWRRLVAKHTPEQPTTAHGENP
ncbi:uncharacterized protein LOC143910808 [Arctopsyche grandis]|uniref:uncharacterized protein LOC143910808 n=1 Tax=Arctopsyche grandis TaxID=121162 RepID=UPI00406D9ABB